MSSVQTTINTFFDTCNSHDSCSSEQTTFHDDIPSQMENIPKKVYLIKKCNVRIYCLSLAGIKCVSCSYEFKNYFGTLSFNCQDSDLLVSINADVKKILERFKNQLPTFEGLILRPCAAV